MINNLNHLHRQMRHFRGFNDLGQLGNTTVSESSTPVLVDQSNALGSGLLRGLDIAGSGSSAAHNLSVDSIPVKVPPVATPVGDPDAALRALYLKQFKKFKKKKKVAAATKFKKKAKAVKKKLAAL